MAYVTDLELTAYATARGYTLVGTASVLITQAHDYIESLTYAGFRTDSTQTDSFPRVGIYVDNIEVDSASVPQKIKDAEMQLAIEIDKGFNPLTSYGQGVKREKIEVIEVEYMDGSSKSPVINSVMALLRPFMSTSNGIRRA